MGPSYTRSDGRGLQSGGTANISGTFNVGRGDRFDQVNGKMLPAGSFMLMPPKTKHFAWVKEETIIQINGVGPWALNFVNPADDPRKK